MKFATYAMIFNQDKWVLPFLDNVYPHVDRIYLSYSKWPWSYNSEARNLYTNKFDINLIRYSKYFDKITLIEGKWDTDAKQRTACLYQAKSDEIDFLIAQDVDEFFFHEDYEKLKWIISTNPLYDAYNVKQYAFWKSFKYIICNSQTGRNAGYGQKVINVKTTERYYEEALSTRPKRIAQIDDVIYYHGSYVLSNEEVYQKIKTWTHTNDFDVDKWYNNIWLKWTVESRNLHPIWPEVWSHCEEFNDKLPNEIKHIK